MIRKTGKKVNIVLITVAALILVIAILLLDSRYRMATTKYEIYSSDLPASFEGYRIVQISDLHGSEFGENNINLIKKIKSQNPDLIALTGDFISYPEDVEPLRPLLEALVKIAPVYFVSGNHDWASGAINELAALLEETGVKYLRNDYLPISKGSESIVLAGVEDPNGWEDMPKPDDVVEQIRSKYEDSYILMLAHRNYWISRYPDLDVDLILCGHSHGGIIRLPFLGGVLGTNLTFFPDYDAGLYEITNYNMLVSRGMGNSVRVPRFLNNKELVVIDLHAE